MENAVISDFLNGLCLLVSLLLLNLVKSRWRMMVPGTVTLQVILKMVKLFSQYVDLLQPMVAKIQKELRLSPQKESEVMEPGFQHKQEAGSRAPKSEEL